MRTFITAVSVIALASVAFVGLNSFSSINPGEKGVIVTLGKVAGEAEPGVFFKTPFVTNVHTFNTRDQVQNFDGLTAYTKDEQTATINRVSITYRVNPADVSKVYLQYGSTENMVNQLVTRGLNANLEKAFGQFNAQSAVQQRGLLGQTFSGLITEGLEQSPLIITAVNIENISFPAEYEANINARMEAEVAARRAEETAKKTVTEAQALADSRLAVAKADAEATRLRGEAEADAIRARSEALKESPNLVALTAAEKWDGILPKTMLPNGSTPMINLGAIID